MAKSNASGNLSQNQIHFGNNLIISTNKRLPLFDNGGALAYEAHSSVSKQKKLIAIVSGVENFPRWMSVPGYKKLNDVSFMNLVDSGSVLWPLDNVEKFVVVYTGGVGKPLVEEGGFGRTSWRHPEIVTLFIEPMASMLKDMRDKGISHGSIRPSNIFCSDKDGRPIVLGDCLSVQAHSSQPALFLPANKAMADPMGRGFGTISDDIYAFGVSLFLFLRRHDELSAFDDEEILRRKVEFGSYSTLIGKERLPVSFLELLKGVLYDDETQRWSVDDIFSWLDGVSLTSLTLPRKKKANRPLVFNGKKYFFAEMLAIDLHHNPGDLSTLMDNGVLDRWVRKALDDSALVERYEKALEHASSFDDASQNNDYLVFHMGIALNPVLPVRYKGMCFTYDGMGALLAKAAYEGKDTDVFKEILNLNILDYALVAENMAQAMMLTILKQYDACRSALIGKKAEQGIERCIYTLCLDAPCLSPKLRGYFVYDSQSTVLTFESLCKKGGQISLMMDKHLLAFFSVRASNLIDSFLPDFNSGEKDRQISSNLHFMAMLQRRAKVEALPAVADVFVGSLSGVYKIYKNTKTRKRIEDDVRAAAKDGDLVAMSALIDDPDALSMDDNGFDIAMGEYKLLQREYDQYNQKLANKKTYGMTNGHDVAATVSWLVSTVITVIVMLAFVSGNRIF
ncbi:MAG: hypothetical protein COB36_02515 [Alphaproteobacteria bacterium]|nr:MAG: hypothetical protein COB36_02515 [Alphaproteobacteria bacterium]